MAVAFVTVKVNGLPLMVSFLTLMDTLNFPATFGV